MTNNFEKIYTSCYVSTIVVSIFFISILTNILKKILDYFQNNTIARRRGHPYQGEGEVGN